MHYAKTLAVTAEREFLRYKKVTADGRTADFDPSDLCDLLHLDQSADRVLPNGWCMLPPKRVCSKGNACLTCDKLVTDAGHQDELKLPLEQAEALIARRQTQFVSRPGQLMGKDNVWLSGRLAKTNALSKVLVALDRVGVQDGENTSRGARSRHTRSGGTARRSKRGTQTVSPLPEHLHQAAEARTTDADEQARTDLAQMVRTGQAISFTAVAREAGVSTDFLYRHPQLRSMIEPHRAKHGQIPAVRQADTEAPSSTSAAVRALSARLSEQQQGPTARRSRSYGRPWRWPTERTWSSGTVLPCSTQTDRTSGTGDD
ncbi:DUF6262 family protein [Streptomyces sp. NPDC087263]|uniref:DUF6262 family protein n=1 Tax=Streptomyces sp. NPDC087263 TaxID=3365773 RepID=UPI00380E5439